ncbi:MAG: acyl-CoA dehydrogenase family protein [Myxococcota bacterium]
MNYRYEPAFIHPAIADAVRQRVERSAEAIEGIEAQHAPGPALVALVRHFGSTGLLDLVVSRREGGAFPEVSSRALSVAREWLGWHSPLADLAFAMQGLGSYPLTLAASPLLRERWLAEVRSGEAVAAFAITEPGAGSDLSAISATATRDGDDYRLDGEKAWISNAPIADFFSIFVGTRPPGEPKRLTAFFLPKDAPGLSVQPTEVLGGHPIGALQLDGVRVPMSSRLGDEGEGMRLALSTLSRFRTTVGAAAIGFAQRALDESVRHVRNRRQFGAPLAELQAVQLRLSEMAVAVETGRLLVGRAAKLADEGADRATTAHASSMAKLEATEGAQRAIDHAVQLHGGLGVASAGIVARLYQEVRALRIYEGTSDIQKMLIARGLLRAE